MNAKPESSSVTFQPKRPFLHSPNARGTKVSKCPFVRMRNRTESTTRAEITVATEMITIAIPKENVIVIVMLPNYCASWLAR
eukprot:733488-Amphidinium_carterae.1